MDGEGHRRVEEGLRRMHLEIRNVDLDLTTSVNSLAIQEAPSITRPSETSSPAKPRIDPVGMIPDLPKPAHAQTVEVLRKQFKNLAIVAPRCHQSGSTLSPQDVVHGG
jgi:hypothetical protein